MRESIRDYGVLAIEGSDYKIENASEFGKSYFRNEYLQAYKTVNMIVNNTIERKMKKTTQTQNVIPFIGKRGTGKTSAMLSFAKSLQEYHKELEKRQYRAHSEEWRYQQTGQALPDREDPYLSPYYTFRNDRGELINLNFVCLDCIDGFLLEEGEDIFRIILGQMYAKIEDFRQRGMRAQDRGNYEYELRELHLRFDKVYRTVCTLGRTDSASLSYGESAITSLKNLTSSLTIKKEFAALVQQYLQVMAYKGDEYPRQVGQPLEQFLVVTIDDLDMNIGNGFEILGKITRYMMVDNVIVLFAADYDQLKILCEHEFYQMVPNFDRKLREKDSDVDRLARDYLDKVLPADDRIHIPDLRKVTDVQISVGNSDHVQPKELIFETIKKKLGMRMDTAGSKRHFYEQSSLRTLVNFYLMLERMEDLNKDNLGDRDNVSLTAFENNYRILLSDTLTRMVDEKLSSYYKKVFHRITEMPMPHSFRNLYFEILKSTGDADEESETDLSRRNKAYLPGLIENLDYYGYSYGEVLRIIYCWGRESVQCKETIRCLIAFYSLEMNRSFRHYCEAADQKQRETERLRFVETMNGSVAGSWTNKMFPRVWYKGAEHLVGYRRDVDMKEVFQFEFSLEGIPVEDGLLKIDVRRMLRLSKLPSNAGASASFMRRELKTCRQLFRTVLVLGMFFEQPYYKTERTFSWMLERTEVSHNEPVLEDELTRSYETISIRNSGGKAYFGIFSFVSNAFQYKENMRPLMEKLYECLFPAMISRESHMEVREAFFESLGIDQEFSEWEKKSHGFALPVYDFDVMYNLMKRLRQKGYYSESVEPRNVLSYLRTAGRFITRKLDENDQFYNQAERVMNGSQEDTTEVAENKNNFKNIFVSCPFVKWIYMPRDKNNGETYLLPQFTDMFTGIIERLLYGNTSSELQEDTDAPDIHGYDD